MHLRLGVHVFWEISTAKQGVGPIDGQELLVDKDSAGHSL